MRVCLINPPRIHPKLWGKPSTFQPVEIAYIAAVLEKQHKVQIIDAPGEGWNNLQEIEGNRYRQGLLNGEIASRVNQFMPDLVAVNVPFSGWWNSTYEVIKAIKGVDKNVKVALTGLHPSTRPNECLADPGVDFVVIGEPEETMLELANTLESQGDLSKVKGIGYVQDGKAKITASRPPIEDLDSLPNPARHLLPMEKYFEAVKESPLRGEIRKPWAMIVTSRGCPFNCIFCSIHSVMGKKWRARSPRNVIAEITQLISTYGVKQFDFCDENIALDKKRLEEICDLIIQKKLNIEWYTPNGVRADTVDENLLAKMRKAGCRRIRFAPESGSQHVINEVMKKNLDLRKVQQAVVMSRKVGLKVGCFFVLGLIGETKADIEETIEFAYKLRGLGADRFYFSIAMPLYGTELYEQAKNGGYLKAGFNDDALAATQPLIETPEFTAADLLEFSARANMVNPTFTGDKIKGAIRHPKKAVRFLLKMK